MCGQPQLAEDLEESITAWAEKGRRRGVSHLHESDTRMRPEFERRHGMRAERRKVAPKGEGSGLGGAGVADESRLLDPPRCPVPSLCPCASEVRGGARNVSVGGRRREAWGRRAGRACGAS